MDRAVWTDIVAVKIRKVNGVCDDSDRGKKRSNKVVCFHDD